MSINSYTEFQPLNSLLVGSVFENSFFDDIANATIREGLKEIVETAREDIENFIRILKDRNITIHQMSFKDLEFPDSIIKFTDKDGCIGKEEKYSWGYRNGLPDPPLCLREHYMVIGKKILVTDNNDYNSHILTRKYKQIFGDALVDTVINDKNICFKRSDVNIKFKINRMKLIDSDLDVDAERKKIDKVGLYGFCAPNLTRVGKTILVDVWQTPNIIDEFLKPHFPEYNFKKVFVNEHNENAFSVIRPGLVLASSWFKNNEKIFPKNWDIIWFDDNDWKNKYLDKLELKRSNNGLLWYPEKKYNPKYEKFIDKWLKNKENLFDVKVLMLDENTCVVSAKSSYIIKELEKRNIEVLYIPFRNRYFWNRGWHSNTLDINREGDLEDYRL